MWISRALVRVALVVAPFVGLAVAAAPLSAAPKGPAAVGSCYFDNGDGTTTAAFS